MTPDDLSAAVLAAYLAALVLPFAICFALSRRGQARTAWWLPGGLFAMTLLFVAMGVALSGEMQTGLAAAGGLVTLGLPAVLGGVAGILLGRRKA
jgi:hypothetical protein